MNTPASEKQVDDLRKELIITIPVVGAVVLGFVLVVIAITIILLKRVSSLKTELNLLHISLRSMEKGMSQTHAAIEKFPKSIVQFPLSSRGSVGDDNDKAGTEPASPIFYRKGYSPTPLASSLTSVSEIAGENQVAHFPLHRSNAMLPMRVKQPGPPVPPKRSHSFNNNNNNNNVAFNY